MARTDRRAGADDDGVRGGRPCSPTARPAASLSRQLLPARARAAGPAAVLVLPAARQLRPAAADRPDHGLLGDQRQGVRRATATPSPRSPTRPSSPLLGLVAFWVCQRLPARTLRALGKYVLGAAVVLLARARPAGRAEVGRRAQRAEDRPDPAPTCSGSTSARSSSSRPSWPSSAWCSGAPTSSPARAPALGHWRELATPLFPVVGLLFVLVGYNDLGTMLVLLALDRRPALGGRACGCGSSPRSACSAWPASAC